MIRLDSFARSFARSEEAIADIDVDATRIADGHRTAPASAAMTDTLIELLVDSFDRNHDRVAIREYDHSITYGEMLSRSVAVSRRLPVKRNDRVGVLLPIGADAVVAMLGVWMAGAVAVPLDVGTPARRLAENLDRFDVRAVVAGGAGRAELATPRAGWGLPLTVVDPDCDLANRPGSATVSDVCARDADGDYLILTSGSVGPPKAVLGRGSALAHYLMWQVKELELGPGDRCSHMTPLWFDFSFKEVWAPLLAGASVYVTPLSARANTRALSGWISAAEVSRICLLPFRFAELLSQVERLEPADRVAAYRSVRTILISGEPLRSSLVTEWQRTMPGGPDLMNLYGPTESTVIKLYYRIPRPFVSRGAVVPLGHPIPGAEVELLTRPEENDGETGEIAIRSLHLAAGYQGDDAATARAFVPGPPGTAPLLRTGDRGRRLPDGCIEYLGRIDRVVKRRGIRISLDHLEQVAAGHAAVDSVAAVSVAGDVPVVAVFYTLRRGAEPATDVRGHLSDVLGPQAAPDLVRAVPLIPRTTRGKKDYAALARSLVQRPDPDPNEGEPESLVDRS
jgi:amino acid adenylation domain-containing protein